MKIKRDQAKPDRKKCTSTHRTCEGYQPPFRSVNGQPDQRVTESRAGGPTTEICASEAETVNRVVSTKTMSGVDVDFYLEAENILRAGITTTCDLALQ